MCGSLIVSSSKKQMTSAYNDMASTQISKTSSWKVFGQMLRLFFIKHARWVSKRAVRNSFLNPVCLVICHWTKSRRRHLLSTISLGVDPGSLVVVPQFQFSSAFLRIDPQYSPDLFPCSSTLYTAASSGWSHSVFLRVNYELKMLIMMVALVGYNTIFLHTHAPLWTTTARSCSRGNDTLPLPFSLLESFHGMPVTGECVE